MKCSILHLHDQLSLLEKIQKYFEVARGEVLQTLHGVYMDIEHKLPHSTDVKKDMVVYCNVGRVFLLTCSPQAIYFGRYVDEMNDTFINEVFEDCKKKVKRKKPC
jgi:hypothetical protein